MERGEQLKKPHQWSTAEIFDNIDEAKLLKVKTLAQFLDLKMKEAVWLAYQDQKKSGDQELFSWRLRNWWRKNMTRLPLLQPLDQHRQKQELQDNELMTAITEVFWNEQPEARQEPPIEPQLVQATLLGTETPNLTEPASD